MTVAPRRISTVSGKRSTTSSSLGRLRYRRAAPADKHGGAGQAGVRPADHADEADECGAVRIRRSERVTGKPLQDHPWSAEPNHECVDARFRQTDNDGEAVGQSACAQARSCKRTGGGLTNGLRMGRIMEQAIGLITGGAEGAGDAQDSSRKIAASERAAVFIEIPPCESAGSP